ncbi:hypothetical protein SAMN04488700_0518 [Carnobacterium iners]|uniref:Uncharacterized protein n=1 Tax=Carnobacterium iners TaxID=1073423 RepID=A0A1X7MT33_9LACT|nr:hypothetical protein [Carnobacterium iners]SEL01384.1 hypothetical protein SAMN04488114_12035 [Carnobacterium iners]SMH27196.1 hypothetical protein SAMN04488700_0518 [Carnobacterium iners]
MKRYWKLSTFILIIILTIGIFYLKPLFSHNEYPDFTIKTIKGDSTEIKDLTLQGYYSPDSKLQSNFSTMYSEKTFSLSHDQTIYDGQQSFFSQLSYLDSFSPLNRLQKEHKHFIRGKNLQLQNFFEDDSFIVYVNLDQEYLDKSSGKRFFDISLLNKKTDEQLSYKIDLPEKKDYQYVGIQKIQIINSSLSVVTRNELSQTNNQDYQEELQEYHIYQLDLGNQKVATDNLISFEKNPSSSELTRVELLSETQLDQTSDDLIFCLFHDQPINEQDESASLDSRSRILDYELVHYKISTNESKKIPLPKEFSTLNSAVISDKKTLYSYYFIDKKLTIYTTTLSKPNESSKLVIDLPVLEDSIEWESIKNNKLYLVSATKESPLKKKLSIYHLTDGELIYEGSIEPTADNTLTKKNNLTFDNE